MPYLKNLIAIFKNQDDSYIKKSKFVVMDRLIRIHADKELARFSTMERNFVRLQERSRYDYKEKSNVIEDWKRYCLATYKSTKTNDHGERQRFHISMEETERRFKERLGSDYLIP